MKNKMLMLAISAILVTNVCAQEQRKECFDGKKLSKEERVEFGIKRLTNELLLSDQQAEKFAALYKEYAAKLDELFQKNVPAKPEGDKELTEADLDKMAKQRFEGFKNLADLQYKYYDKFRKFLSARQVEKIMRLDEPFGPKPCCGKQCGKHDGQFGPRQEKCAKHGPRPDGPHPAGPCPKDVKPAPKEE